MGLYQVSSNYGPGVEFDPTPGVTNFTWYYIGKFLEVSLYVAYIGKIFRNLPVPSHKA